jgi:hypothetical protein
MNLISQHAKAKEVQERDRQEIRDLLLSILSNDDTKNMSRMTDSRDIDEIMGSIQTVSINPFYEGEQKAHPSRNCLTQYCNLKKKGLSRQDYGPFTRKRPSYHL